MRVSLPHVVDVVLALKAGNLADSNRFCLAATLAASFASFRANITSRRLVEPVPQGDDKLALRVLGRGILHIGVPYQVPALVQLSLHAPSCQPGHKAYPDLFVVRNPSSPVLCWWRWRFKSRFRKWPPANDSLGRAQGGRTRHHETFSAQSFQQLRTCRSSAWRCIAHTT